MTYGEAAYTQFIVEYPGPRPEQEFPSWGDLKDWQKAKWERIAAATINSYDPQ